MDRNVEFYKNYKQTNIYNITIYICLFIVIIFEYFKQTNIYSNIINICLFIVIIFEYFKTGTIQYNLFLIFFVGQLSKSVYKYRKDKNNLNLACVIGCIISVVALIVLVII